MSNVTEEQQIVEEIEFLARSVNRIQLLAAIGEAGTIKKRTLQNQFDVARTTFVWNLESLEERGYVDRETDDRGYTWRDTGLHRVNEHGDVELEPVDIGSLDADEVAELVRDSIYTWEFRHLGGDTSPSSSASATTTSVGVDEAVVGGDPPLDEAD